MPTLRGLQSLERVGGEVAAAPQRRWGPRQGLLFLGGVLAVVSLAVAVWLEFTKPVPLMIVERFLPKSVGGKDVFDSPVSAADFHSLKPAEVWLTWQITAPVGADRRYTRGGIDVDHYETLWNSNWHDWRYLDWGAGGIGVALIAIGLLIPERRARRPVRRRAGAAA